MRFQYQWHQELPSHIILQEGVWYDIKEVENTRSIRQNSLLHGYIYQEAIEAFRRKGKILNSEHIHLFFKNQFLKKRKKCKITWRYRFQEWSTAKLSTKAFSAYIESIRTWVFDTLEYDIQPVEDKEALLFYQNQM